MNRIVIDDSVVAFSNHVDDCVGTGRMDLALHKEYYEQLKMVQENIGFRYIRGHGLFSKDMGIYRVKKNREGVSRKEYNFTYLDQVFDMYQELNIKPFLELGFMPDDMASGDQAQFYWKGNVTPPSDYADWAELIKKTLMHLIERYGLSEVLTWPIEVWNEPNLTGFWQDADMQEYFRLYEVSALAVKEIHADLRVGGPAVCGGSDKEWVEEFLLYVRSHKLPLDFVSRHHYTSYLPEHEGDYGYIKLHDPNYAFDTLHATHEIMNQFPEFANLEIYITEFNTSYIPRAPIHDTNFNAAYVAHMLSKLGDHHASYSYWTFGDVFEEWGPQRSLFHGGFGMVANGCIPKPTYQTFSFFKKLQGKCVHRSENVIIVKREDGSYYGVAWNPDMDGKQPCYQQTFSFPIQNRSCIITKRVNEECCNPLKVWHDLGEPANPSREDVALIREAANPQITTTTNNGACEIDLQVVPNEVVAFEVREAELTSDYGYDYERTIRQYVGEE